VEQPLTHSLAKLLDDMISTSFSLEEYQSQRITRAIEEGQEFVPDGDGEKWYTVVCANGEDWKYIHDRIVEDDCQESNIPTPHRDCVDESKSCSRMGSFLLNDAEAEDLRNHPKVLDIELDPNHYEGTFKGVEDLPRYNFIDKFDSNVSLGRDFSSSFFPTTPGSSLLARTGASIWRHSYKDDPWDNISDSTILSGNPQVLGDGTDVDVIVCDESGWYGHIEFIKTGVGEPKNFVGENVLKAGFAPSATTGVCGVLDMVLDTPYYIDPDFFEASPSTRLTKRWDGTTVPVESVARDWWRNESTTYRSAKYVGTSSGGTATTGSAEDFGTVSVNTAQTRANSNGSNTAQHNSGGYHATPCMAQSYGKTHGFAYNSNKWHMSIIWRTGSQSISNMFRILKIFHQLKPNRTSDNTKNPTITSHSWGRSYSFGDGYYFYRQTTNGVSFTTSAKPAFLNYFYGGNKHEKWERQTQSETVLGHEMLDAGVIFLSAAGNNNQKQVLPGHPDYDNYHGSSSTYALSTAEYNGRMTHRPGFPSSIGYVSNYMGTGQGGYRTFNIGALDSNKSSTTQERKASYSNMGNAIDCYAIGADSLSATDDNTSTRYNRYDGYYRIDSNYAVVTSGGTLSDDSQDRQFGGTSSATPVTCGLMATKLQFFRDWTWENIKTWLAESVENQGSTKFFTGTEAVTATDSNYNSYYNLQGADSKIIYDALSGDEPSEEIKLSGSGLTMTGVNLKIV
jgi:hypothetical protein